MALKVIGAGYPRTGTMSLKLALEELLGAPCYHMADVHENSAHVPIWHKACMGEYPDWEQFFSGYAAAVDAPAAAFWSQLMHRFPDALIVLSVRSSSEKWWESIRHTILDMRPPTKQWEAMVRALPFVISPDQTRSIDAYEQHNRRVQTEVPKERLLVWQAEDGWEPLCRALNLPVPSMPFPHVNTKQEFRDEHKHALLSKLKSFFKRVF